MITTLGLLAALILIPILLRVGVRLFALLFVRTALVRSAEDIGARALEKQSNHVHLSPRGPQVWVQPDAAGALATPLLENGFDDAGTYAVDEMPGVFLRLLVDQHNGILGIVYEHPRAPHWVELVTYYANTGSCAFTSMRPTGLAARPGHPVLYAPGLDAGALLHRALQERPYGETVTLSTKSAVKIFEYAYADHMAWRKQHGVSASEVIQVAARRAA